MSKFVFYIPSLGKITKVVQCSGNDAALNKADNEKMLEVPMGFNVSNGTHYVDDTSKSVQEKVLLEGPQKIVLLVGDTTSILLPELCLVTISGEAEDLIEVKDGELVLEFTTPGEYLLDFEMIRHIKPEAIIHVQTN